MSETDQVKSNAAATQEITSVAIRFAGDSGDGIQLTGARFTQEVALAGSDLATLPDFPAEIRAPAGSLPGVSSFQIQFGGVDIFTAGDQPDVLVAMNPAALKVNLAALKPNGILICNTDAFSDKNLKRAGYEFNPLEDQELEIKYQLVRVQLSSLTAEALKDFELPKSAVERSKNFLALGIVCWMYDRSAEDTLNWIDKKFSSSPEIAAANKAAMLAGMAFAQASELFNAQYEIQTAHFEPGTYRNVTGNLGLAYGLIAGAKLSGLPLFYAGYPITPASDILHELSKHKRFGVLTFQAEDEIAACCAAIGAAYGGQLAVTASSGPGIALKQEAIGLAVMAELPMVIVDVQRAGPSTGMPTKTEQADLLQVMFGRNSDCPTAVLAIASPGDAFETAVEACRIALEHMIPVFLLSDGYIGNGSQPWRIPEISEIEPIKTSFAEATEDFAPYAHDSKSLARKWAIPGTPGLEHRVGGLEKENISGNVSYDPANHQLMTEIRAEKVRRIADRYAATEVHGDPSGELLVVSWGGTWGSITAAVNKMQAQGKPVSHVHLRHLNPLPNDLEKIMKSFKRVLVPELNVGQLSMLLRSQFLIDVKGFNKIQGLPFTVSELVSRFEAELKLLAQ